ncbi:MAG: hypothetical protein EP305_11800, partial [Bacteroidetes bacterium]
MKVSTTLILIFLGVNTLIAQIYSYSEALNGRYVHVDPNCKRTIEVGDYDGLFAGTFEDCNDLREYYVYNSDLGDYYVMVRMLQDEIGEYKVTNEISFELIDDKVMLVFVDSYDGETGAPNVIYFQPQFDIDPIDLVEGNYEYVDETYMEDDGFFEEENGYYSVIDVGGNAFLEENDWMSPEFEGTCLMDPVSERRLRIQKVGDRVYGFAYDYFNGEFLPFGYFQWEKGAYMQWKIESSGEIVIDDDLFEHNK